MNTISAEWVEYERSILAGAPNATPAQRRALRGAFYGGAIALLTISNRIAEMSDDAAAAVWESLQDESVAHIHAQLAARAERVRNKVAER